ncbi:MAG: Alkaline phosphatase synthesis transcriptional regulatory protein PhoP [Bacteroidia bacterium]|nr:Alkaline phosphatase synthesis transcriptional regulatory protein PhoP [Bacteroidia bacterium]
MEKQKILIVDDEPDILEFMQYNLEKEGFEVFMASSGKQAIKIAKDEQPDLIILDVMMPGMDGIETCRELRSDARFRDTIIAFLTARNEDYSQIAGFESGADDYIAKPIKPRVLVSRIKALLKRSGHNTPDPVTEIGGLIIDRNTYTLTKNGKELFLPKKEFELLAFLASKPGKVFNRDEILNRVWGNEVVVGDRTIDVHIRRLREKVGDKTIRTIKGVGYKFEE